MSPASLAMQGGSWVARFAAWRDRKVADAGFRAWATQFPLTRPIARRRARELFDLCAGFAYSQVLQSCVELRLFETLEAGPKTPAQLAPALGLTPARAERLLEAAAALRLLRRRGAAFGLGKLGAAMLNNPGVTAMVQHHAMLYADLADPVALLRDAPGHTLLAGYWPYGGAERPDALESGAVAGYSRLMATSLPLVAAQVLGAYDLRRHRCLLDVGGGEGAFLEAAKAAAPGLRLMLFDLPPVAACARGRLGDRAGTFGGDMRTGPLPEGADVLSLVRVIHDHDDEPALDILRTARRALSPGGTLLLAEPMLDSPGAEPVGAYFTFYLLALGSGRPRTAATLTAMLKQAGFGRVKEQRTADPLLCSLLVAAV